MKICKDCGGQFKAHVIVEGKRRSLTSRKRCLNCSPFGIFGRTWTDQQLIGAINDAACYSDVLRQLGLMTRGSNWKHIKKHISRLGIDVSHFDGVAVAISKLHCTLRVTDEEVFCKNSKVSQATLRNRLRKAEKIDYCCDMCNIIEIIDFKAYYNNVEIILQVDHINGDNKDNRIENLRWICPNCHTQTKTFSRSNYKLKQKRQEIKAKFEICKNCGDPAKNKYCSNKCAQKASERIRWPTNLLELVRKTSQRQVASVLGVSDKAVGKRLKNYYK